MDTSHTLGCLIGDVNFYVRLALDMLIGVHRVARALRRRDPSAGSRHASRSAKSGDFGVGLQNGAWRREDEAACCDGRVCPAKVERGLLSEPKVERS